jgi:protein-S-isoprenylcysteine O-methyltransferase Ste14
VWWWACVVVGLALQGWAMQSLPPGTTMQPVPWVERTTRGPYRYLKHPMYVGNWLYIVGFAGYAGGFWNALAVGTVAELLLRDWAGREEGTC